MESRADALVANRVEVVCTKTVDYTFARVIGLKSTDWDVAKTEAGYWLGPWARGRAITARALAAITLGARHPGHWPS